MNGKKASYAIWLGGLGACLLAGLYTTITLFREGHWLFAANDVVVWSLPLGMYIFLALSSSGLAMLSALPTLFGMERLEPFSKRLVFLALATLCGAFVAIALEIGNIGGMIYFILSPNMASPIWWMGALYTAELLFLTVKLGCLYTGDRQNALSKTAGSLSFLCAMAAPMVLGAVFGTTESRAVYFGPMVSIFYLTMALFSGTALFLLHSMICHRLETGRFPSHRSPVDEMFYRLFAWSAGAAIVITGVTSAVGMSTVIPEFMAHRTVNTPFGSLFGFPLEVIVGLMVPFALFMSPAVRKTAIGTLAAALIAWAGSLVIHMKMLINGQRFPVGPKAEQYPEVITYFPSPWEWLVALFALSVMLLLYTLGERYLNLGTDGAATR
ncbi:NrfD/PsrC family molybdoenzyme membrane anchor subunit [Desulfoluna spongiiphila]|uniref:Prokaryotic molybdopterin-containing oxidoreductase family, membrane subunit n=1 Tax=Desulfoluna spongiiphila TaxID=419481 RepID=A0A1G5ERE6_9BACT|nr:NrfD/PsrC family molybdoenzyme membrane anchor subunit [Desulfoluna spongiiphila]SCY29536.1 prokaryotic molybdopterin-containing oxidoreductase family, membrane subunit [Desulfoluna spongiiphila]